ncbi:MAG TPA: FG-GAP-like repeat-containing protein [Verrucomicrobiae bacterium]
MKNGRWLLREARPLENGECIRLSGLLAALFVIIRAALEPACAAPANHPWHAEPGFRWAPLDVPQNGRTGFSMLPPELTGLTFTNILLEFSGATNRILQNGAGVALGDYDRDGWVDIFVCGLDSPSALYRNLGQWRFTNVTAAAGLEFPSRYQRGAAFADINGDGTFDLLVSTLNEGVLCFLNDGGGRFKNVTASANTATRFGSVTMALADVDGDGTLDLYVANNRAEDIRNRGSVRVYMRNGQYVIPPEFKDRLLVINGVVQEFGEPDMVSLNDGQGRFTPLSWTDGRFRDEAGEKLKRPPLDWGQTVAFRDLNGDGTPDIYVCNDYWTADRIWINDGRGNFRAIDGPAIRHTCYSSMGVDFADINRDGFLDIFVTDMQSRDHRLRKRQVFAFNPNAPPFDPMASPIDFPNDRPQIMRNTLFLARGDNTYADIADYAGLSSAEWAWQQIFLDVDLDGYEDLLISAGHFRDVQDRDAIAEIARHQPSLTGLTNAEAFRLAFSMQKMINARLYPPYECPIIAFQNLGNLQFADVTTQWGTDQPGVRHGIAAADLDNDGDLDLVVNTFNGPLGVYRNNSSAHRVAVRLKGRPPNTQGIGAKIKLLNGAVPMQSQEIMCGGHYLSASEPMIVFAAGSATQDMSLEVGWRSGKVSVLSGVRPNRLYEIDEAGTAAAAPAPSQVPPLPLFKDASKLLAHTHHENSFDDFARQPLLPRKLSQPGPGLAWFDVNQDGHEDLILGSGKGGQLAIYIGDGRGGFTRADNPLTAEVAARDQTGILGWVTPTGNGAILTGLANYEDGLAQGAAVSQYLWASNTVSQVIGADTSSTGPILLGDVDGDGDLDLFVGGRVIAGRWPEPASSRLYRNEGGKFVLDTETTRLLEKVGLVSGAVFSDLDGDGFGELVLACEWGSIRLFHNDHGRFKEMDMPVTYAGVAPSPGAAASEAGPRQHSLNEPDKGMLLRPGKSALRQLTGWWNGVTTADLDGDGRLDIIASNWGLNNPYQASPDHPTEVYYGDLGGLGQMDVIEAEFEPELNAIAPRRYRDPVVASLAFVAARLPTHKAFSEASLETVLGEARARARVVQARTLATTAFLNRGNHFEAVVLPPEAQFAPAFAVVAADFDGDGREDVFLSQNFFANEPSTPRCDAGRGLLLLGNGKGGLRAVRGQESGIKVYGEQRGAAAGDFNEDCRVDLAIGQNGGPTVLYQNVQAKPGLRVRLVGPPRNPLAIGAVVRLKFGDRLGAAREIHGGSGYLSEDGTVQVMGLSGVPTQIQIRWPGGKITESMVPRGSEIQVSYDAQVTARLEK